MEDDMALGIIPAPGNEGTLCVLDHGDVSILERWADGIDCACEDPWMVLDKLLFLSTLNCNFVHGYYHIDSADAKQHCAMKNGDVQFYLYGCGIV